MLRSRNTRRQSPSESTDERNGYSRSLSTPSMSSFGSKRCDSDASNVSVVCGTDDVSDYHSPYITPGEEERWSREAVLGGWGIGGGSGGVGVTIQELGQQRNRHVVVSGGRWRSYVYNCVAYIALVTSVVLGVWLAKEVERCRLAINAMERELDDIEGRVGRRRHVIDPLRVAMSAIYGPSYQGREAKDIEDVVEDGDWENDQLHSRRQDLVNELAGWEARHLETRDAISDILSKIDSMANRKIKWQEENINLLKTRLEEESKMANEYKRTFLLTHERTSTETNLGPGHAVLQRRVLNEMDSLEDYERYVKDREDALWKKFDALVQKIKRDSRREAIEWFGPGPHSVLMEIEYPDHNGDVPTEGWTRKRGKLRLDMAPLDLMPVAVNLFLQQVHHGLWDGCSFVTNAHHILQAGPLAQVDAGGEEPLLRRFTDAKLDVMPFQEYHEDYPHEKHTVGFAGRPGGPDFYINKINNTISHGPGGQDRHDLHEEADPCFATVVAIDDGTLSLEKLFRIPTHREWDGLIPFYQVLILNAKIMSARGSDESQQPQMTHEEQSRQQA